MVKVLYITFSDMKSCSGASSLRPLKMEEAFLAQDVDLLTLSGEQANALKKIRKARIKNIINIVKKDKPCICYIEGSTYPIMLKADLKLIKYISKMGVPVGYFYRDCYRHPQFQYMVKRKGIVNRLKDVYLNLLQKRTDIMLKKIDIVYFPSLSMANYFNYNNMKALPPAAEKIHEVNHSFKNNAIYVGGVSERYGFPLMLKAFDLLNVEGEYQLLLVCREGELEISKSEINTRPWLKIRHASGEDLKPLYEEATIALLPLLGGYNDFAVSVKMYEYLSYSLPIVSTNIKEMATFIKANGVGVVTEQTPEAFAEGIRKILGSKESWSEMRDNAIKTIKNGNTWNDRAVKVISDLTEIKKRRDRE